jgi:xanthine dehydrogenase large subunit
VLKKGLATMPVKFGISFNRPALNQAGALVHVYTDGSVVLNHGGTEMGQGLFIKVAQVVAETFAIDIDRVRVSPTSTGKVPNTSPTAASSGSDLNGMAAMHACEEIKARMTTVAAEHFSVPAGEIEFASNRIYAGNRSLSFAELAALSWERRVSLSAAGFYRTPKIHWDVATATGRPFYYFVYGAAAAEVAVDTLTGESRVLRAELIQDCGRSLNPAIDLGQIEGAFVQGMGWLTTEELWWDTEGRLRTYGPSTYKIPGSRDIPPIFNARLLPDAPNREATIFRSKAIGEPPLMLAISVLLAIRDALATLADYRHAPCLDAPATPERVLMAIDEVRRQLS